MLAKPAVVEATMMAEEVEEAAEVAAATLARIKRAQAHRRRRLQREKPQAEALFDLYR